MTLPDNAREMVLKHLHVGPMGNADVRALLGFVGTKRNPYCPEVDRLLQRMRKDGEIACVAGKWQLASRQKCDRCGGSGWLS